MFTCNLLALCQTGCEAAIIYRDKIQIRETGNTLKDLQQFFLSEFQKQTESNSSQGGGINVPLKKLKLGVKYDKNKSEYENVVSAINSGSGYLFTDEFKKDIYKEVLNPDAYNKWIECIRLNTELEKHKIELELANRENKNLIGKIVDNTKESFVLKIKWNPSLGVNHVKLKPFVVDGAEYNANAFDINEEIGSEFVSIPFYKIRGKQVRLTVNTVGNKGSFTFVEVPDEKVFSGNFEPVEIKSDQQFNLSTSSRELRLLTENIGTLKVISSALINTSKNSPMEIVIDGELELKVSEARVQEPDQGFGWTTTTKFSDANEEANKKLKSKKIIKFKATGNKFTQPNKNKNVWQSTDIAITECSAIETVDGITSKRTCDKSNMEIYIRFLKKNDSLLVSLLISSKDLFGIIKNDYILR